jgi:hypothetical protein
MLRKAVLFLALAGLCAAQTARQSVKAKKVCDKNAKDCLSGPNSFKCAMAFKNLTKLDGEIKILDIIPDLINQPGVELTDDITEELEEREINFEAFDIEDVCDNKITARKRSNARCYAFLNDYAEEDLDSCDTGLITSDGDHVDEGTVGDALCERAFNLTNVDEATREKAKKNAWIIALVEIGAFHSYCGTDWQEVAVGKGKDRKPLNLKRKMCCFKRPDPTCANGVISRGRNKGKPCPTESNKPKYRPCSGSKKFNQVCDKEKK